MRDQVGLAARKGKTVSPQKGKFTINEAGPDLELLVGVSTEMPSSPNAICPKLKTMLKEGHKSASRILIVDVGAFAGKIDGHLKFNGVGQLKNVKKAQAAQP